MPGLIYVAGDSRPGLPPEKMTPVMPDLGSSGSEQPQALQVLGLRLLPCPLSIFYDSLVLSSSPISPISSP